MSDTQFIVAGKPIKVTGSLKSVILYVVADACVSLSQSFMGMDHATWSNYWWMQKCGFWLAQVGSTALMVKAFYSGSSPNKQPTPPVT